MLLKKIFLLLLFIFLFLGISYAENFLSQDILNEIQSVQGVLYADQPDSLSVYVYSDGTTNANAVCNILYRHRVKCFVHILNGQAALAGDFKEIDSCNTY